MSNYPNIEELVPHAKPLLLVDEVLEAGEEHIVCRVLVRDDGLFNRHGIVPGWLGMEYMAQTVAAFSGWRNWKERQPVKVGLLLGTRRYSTSGAGYRVGDELTVRAERVIEGAGGMSAFECRISGSEIEQKATLSLYEPPNADAFLERQVVA
jgi:predicted hotdog family 3-hydroxylacyl-ACP dehydratase